MSNKSNDNKGKDEQEKNPMKIVETTSIPTKSQYSKIRENKEIIKKRKK